MKRFLRSLLMLAALIAASIIINPTEAHAATVDDLTFELNSDGNSYKVLRCAETASGEIIIPATYNGKPVTTIGYDAFYSRPNLTGVTIPEGVTTIYSGAFENCPNLKNVSIPDSITYIGAYVFDRCDSLTYSSYHNAKYLGNTSNPYLVLVEASSTQISNCQIHSTTRIIYEDAFYDCRGLTNITIPDGVTCIGPSAFAWCDSLVSITIPDKVTNIGYEAFRYCTSLTSITVPCGVNTIEVGTFYSCNGLTCVTIGDGITSIETEAFMGCNKLSDVYYTGTPEQWMTISVSSWAGAPFLNATMHFVSRCDAYGHTEEVISGKVATCTKSGLTEGKQCSVCGEILVEQEEISATGHTEEVLPAKAPTAAEPGLTEGKKCSICGEILAAQEEISAWLTFTLDSKGQYYTLTKCATSVSGEVTIPATYNGLPVTAIGPSAFSGCTKVQAINIPASIQKIGYAAFYNCKALAEITIPEGITDVLYSTFAGCTGLVKVTLPSTLKQIGELAFDNCKNLTTINIPEGVTTISRVAFFNCRSLDGINLPKTLTTLGDSAFYDCKSLTAITIPGSLTRLQKSTFYGCSKLETLVIEDGVKTIEGYVFYACVSLKTVTLTDSVTYIGSYVFNNCTALTDVYYSGTQAQWDALALGISNAPIVKATLHLQGPCAEGHTYDHDYDKDCNVCAEVRQLNNTYKFVNYRVVFADPDTTHKNLRVEVYKLGDKTVADPTDEKTLKAIDANPVTYWNASNINKICITDAGNYVLLLKYNIGTGLATKVPMQITVSADPKLIIDKNNKLTILDNNGANINHRVVVYYLGDKTVEDIYDEAALNAIDSAAETVWQKVRINKLALIKGGNYVLHLCYNVGTGAKQLVAQTFTVESIPTLSVNINNKVVVTEENAENRNHRAVVYFLGDAIIEDPYDETAIKAAALTTSKTYWGLNEINSVELKEGGNYVIHLYYNVGISEKRTLALDVTVSERPALSLSEDNKLVVTYSDPDIDNVRAYIYKVDNAKVSDIYDEAALKEIVTPTQVWGLSSILRKQLTEPGTYMVHLYYNVGTSAKKTVAIKVTV